VLLERPADSLDADAVLLLGAGESSDAHHMSSPHPEGLGARMAMEAALKAAGLQPADIDYINLHGTATPSNDAAEGGAVASLFGDPCRAARPRARPATPWARPAAWRRSSARWRCSTAFCRGASTRGSSIRALPFST
jgi:hypothetical protein